MINTEQLAMIIDDLKHVSPDIENNIIFSEACRYQRGMMITKQNAIENPVTAKQLEHLKKNEKKLLSRGITLDKITTTKQASNILNELWKKK